MKQIFTSARFVGFKFIVVSLFSGMGGLDTGLARSGMTIGYANDANFNACLIHMARFKHDDGTPVMTSFTEIDEETFKRMKASDDTEDYCGVIDGKYYRTRLVQEITGQEIRTKIEQRYGKNVIIVLSSGAPCQEMSLMSINARRGKTNPSGKNSKHLVLEFSRIVSELNPDAICAEEVPELKLPQNKDVYDKMMAELNAMPYSMIENELCSCHYGGAQIRWRHFMLAIHAKYKTMPVFPVADPNSAKRVKDVLPYVKYFSSEQFTDKIKTSNYVLCTITRGTPAFFWDSEGRKWTPTIRELMKFVGFDDDHIIPDGIPENQVRLAIGNTVCTYVAEAIGRSLIKSITDALSSDDGLISPDGPGPDDSSGPVEGDHPETGESDEGRDMKQSDKRPGFVPDEGRSDGRQVEPSSKKALVPGPKSTTRFFESGFEIWRGKSLINGAPIVVVLTLHSANAKTGDMAQLYILTDDIDPAQAIKLGEDQAICGDCKLRHYKDGACYVWVSKDPLIVWRAWKNDAYPILTPEHYQVLNGLSVRFGAYGDPAAVPFEVLQKLKNNTKNYTGYTHQWRSESAAQYKSICMASVETEDELQAASEMGWSTFRILHEGEPLSDKERMCPHITHGIQCVKCNLCRGSEPIKRRIAIGAHGSRRSKFRSAELTPAIDHSSNVIGKVHSELPPPLVLYQPNEEEEHTNHQPRVEVIYDGSKIISSIDLLKIDFETLPFAGGWLDFLGEPSSCFHMAVFGRAGQGKSTFSIQVANYLANNFGSAIYVSGEEGFCLTFQKKFMDHGAASPHLDVADIRTYHELVKSIEPGRYRFILLDSLDTLKINAEQLRELKLRYKDCAFITISQVTKSGDARGSYQVMHDADIIVEVIHGKAITIKNRFHPTEKLYPVFK